MDSREKKGVKASCKLQCSLLQDVHLPIPSKLGLGCFVGCFFFGWAGGFFSEANISLQVHFNYTSFIHCGSKPLSSTVSLVIYMPFQFICGAIRPWAVLHLMETGSLQDHF